MADFQVVLAALLSPDNETRNQAEVGGDLNRVSECEARMTEARAKYICGLWINIDPTLLCWKGKLILSRCFYAVNGGEG